MTNQSPIEAMKTAFKNVFKLEWVELPSISDSVTINLQTIWETSWMDACKYMNEEYETLLNPRLWTKEMSDAWHSVLPDVNKAFENLRELKEPTNGECKHGVSLEHNCNGCSDGGNHQ